MKPQNKIKSISVIETNQSPGVKLHDMLGGFLSPWQRQTRQRVQKQDKRDSSDTIDSYSNRTDTRKLAI